MFDNSAQSNSTNSTTEIYIKFLINIFHYFGAQPQIEKSNDPKIWLKQHIPGIFFGSFELVFLISNITQLLTTDHTALNIIRYTLFTFLFSSILLILINNQVNGSHLMKLLEDIFDPDSILVSPLIQNLHHKDLGLSYVRNFFIYFCLYVGFLINRIVSFEYISKMHLFSLIYGEFCFVILTLHCILYLNLLLDHLRVLKEFIKNVFKQNRNSLNKNQREKLDLIRLSYQKLTYTKLTEICNKINCLFGPHLVVFVILISILLLADLFSLMECFVLKEFLPAIGPLLQIVHNMILLLTVTNICDQIENIATDIGALLHTLESNNDALISLVNIITNTNIKTKIKKFFVYIKKVKEFSTQIMHDPIQVKSAFFTINLNICVPVNITF